MKKRTIYLALEADNNKEVIEKIKEYMSVGWKSLSWPYGNNITFTDNINNKAIAALSMTIDVLESTDINPERRIKSSGEANMSRELSDWITSFTKYTNNSEPSKMYRLWTGIAVIAGVLQRKCRLDWGSLTFYPNMYTILVGPPAARKGTSMNFGRPFLEDLQVKMAAEAITREALIRELKNATDTEVTIEGKMFFHSSLTIWSQELTVFLGHQNFQLMSDLTDWYDCRNQWTYRTKNMGTDEIIGVYVNIFAATTPDLIRSALPLDAIGGGLTSRMIFVYEKDKGKFVPYPGFSKEELILGEQLKRDLSRIHMLSGNFKVQEDFLNEWIEWYPYQGVNQPFVDSRFDGYFERRANHIMKLSMIVNASRTDNMIITVEDLRRAIEILELTEKNMPLTFSGVGKLSTADVMTKIMNDIGMSNGMRFSEILNIYKNDVDKWILTNIMGSLDSMKFIVTVHEADDTMYYHKETYLKSKEKK